MERVLGQVCARIVSTDIASSVVKLIGGEALIDGIRIRSVAMTMVVI